MSAAASPSRFVIVDANATAGSFLRAAFARWQARHWLWALGLFLAAQADGATGRGLERVLDGSSWVHDGLEVGLLMLAVLAADEAVARGARPWPSYALAVVVGSALHGALQLPLLMLFGVEPFGSIGLLRRFDGLFGIFRADILYGAFGCFIYVNRRGERLALERTRAAEIARERARRRTLESQLQAMQARVEPQFLFNTLAQVRDLYARDATLAGRALDDLIAYLRAALPQLRESTSTLGQEVELARAYLDIMKVRLGDRLAVSIDVPDAIKAASLPSMLLLPLVERALRRVSADPVSTGSIRIEARRAGGRLMLAVADGAGVAASDDARDERLDDIAARVRALYGDSARIGWLRDARRGMLATLELPHEERADRGDR